MKPGNLKSDLHPSGQVLLDTTRTTTAEVERVEDKRRSANLEESIPDGRSQLPPAPSSRTDTPGESPLVKGRIEAREEPTKKGKRQKLLKVAEAKTLNKPGRALFRALHQVLDSSVQKLRARGDAPGEFFAPEDA